MILHKITRIGLTVGVLTAMVGLSEVLGEREIIFPEIAAVLVGLVLAPHLPWRTNLPRLAFSLILCALVGTLISVFLPCPLAVKMIVAYLLAQLVLIVTRTTFAPMISAAVLPVLLQTQGLVYFVSAVILTLVCVLIRFLLERYKLAPREIEAFHKHAWGGVRAFVVRGLAASALILLATFSGALFVAAPPLLVAYTQLTRQRNPLRRRPARLILLVFLCATIGTLCRATIGSALLATALATTLMCLLFTARRLYFPPAAAIGILAFLVPEPTLPTYPLQVTLGMYLAALTAARH